MVVSIDAAERIQAMSGQGPDLRVRVATAKDAAAIQAIYAPYVLETAISFEQAAPTQDQIAARMARIGAAFPWLVCDQGGEVAGYAYAGPHAERAAYAWSADTAVYVARDKRGLGVGRALYGRLLPILRLQGFHSALAGVTLPNAPSVGLHEAFGFVLVGVYREVGFKMGAWRDVARWSLSLGPAVADPTPPRPFSDEIFALAAGAG